MKAVLVKTEDMQGISKKTGIEYAIRTVTLLIPISSHDQSVSTADWTRKTQGFNVVVFQPSEGLYQKVQQITRGVELPLEVEVTLDQRIDRDSKLVSYIAEIDVYSGQSE